ncbi:hypothetical protein D6D22_03810 [Aureobasidium pullulans]|uniref:Uncharacterized protein n=1 Tax=Aureobasidium pullulans TaxID=5580 RepID=A0A4S8XWC3_AURPU|nr:hypothetical protein D6D22_03810 [Aureobasidium pullulans]
MVPGDQFTSRDCIFALPWYWDHRHSEESVQWHLGDRELTGCFGRVNLAETTMSVRFILLSCGVCASRSNGVLPNRTWGLKINESLLPQCTSGVNRRVVCPSCKAQAWVAWSWFDLLLMLALSVGAADLPSTLVFRLVTSA